MTAIEIGTVIQLLQLLLLLVTAQMVVGKFATSENRNYTDYVSYLWGVRLITTSIFILTIPAMCLGTYLLMDIFRIGDRDILALIVGTALSVGGVRLIDPIYNELIKIEDSSIWSSKNGKLHAILMMLLFAMVFVFSIAPPMTAIGGFASPLSLIFVSGVAILLSMLFFIISGTLFTLTLSADRVDEMSSGRP